MMWTVKLIGGAFDGGVDDGCDEPPLRVLIAWACPECQFHYSFSPTQPEIDLRTAEAYVLVEADMTSHVAKYEVGGTGAGRGAEDELLVGAGTGTPPAWAR